MAKYLIEGTILTDIADAIREKTGKVDLMKPSQWAVELDNVQLSGQYLWSKKNAVDEQMIGYAASDDASKYPDGGVHTDGYYYELVDTEVAIQNAVRQTLVCKEPDGIPEGYFVSVLQGNPLPINTISFNQSTYSTYGFQFVKWVDSDKFIAAYGTGSYIYVPGKIVNNKIVMGTGVSVYNGSTQIYCGASILLDPLDKSKAITIGGGSECYGIYLNILTIDWDNLTCTLTSGEMSFLPLLMMGNNTIYGNVYGGYSSGFYDNNSDVFWVATCSGFYVAKYNRSANTLTSLGELGIGISGKGGSHSVQVAPGVCICIDTDGGGNRFYAKMVKYTTSGSITEGTAYALPKNGDSGYRNAYPKTVFVTDLGTVLWQNRDKIYIVNYDTSISTITSTTEFYTISSGINHYGGVGKLASGQYYWAIRDSATTMKVLLLTETSKGSFSTEVININTSSYIGDSANLELNEGGYGIMYRYGTNIDNGNSVLYGLFTTTDGVVKAVSNNYYFGVSATSADYNEPIEVDVLA